MYLNTVYRDLLLPRAELALITHVLQLRHNGLNIITVSHHLHKHTHTHTKVSCHLFFSCLCNRFSRLCLHSFTCILTVFTPFNTSHSQKIISLNIFFYSPCLSNLPTVYCSFAAWLLSIFPPPLCLWTSPSGPVIFTSTFTFFTVCTLSHHQSPLFMPRLWLTLHCLHPQKFMWHCGSSRFFLELHGGQEKHRGYCAADREQRFTWIITRPILYFIAWALNGEYSC